MDVDPLGWLLLSHLMAIVAREYPGMITDADPARAETTRREAADAPIVVTSP